MNHVYLKPHKDKPVLRRHPWIFSGAIERYDPETEDGQIVEVLDSGGNLLGYGHFNSQSQIMVRMLSFGGNVPDHNHLEALISHAIARRSLLANACRTNAYRLINSEGDFLPGLIVDYYDRHCVLQLLTLGMDKMRDVIVDILIKVLNPGSIYERSDHPGRKLEGLEHRAGQVYGTTPASVCIDEDSMIFSVDIRQGQKTGFFIDQRDNRSLVRNLSSGLKVLNLFSYTGGFSVAAARGGAREVISVDSSASAIALARSNLEANAVTCATEFVETDVFEYLRQRSIESNFIILDPPAFAKNRASAQSACKGYKHLNLRTAISCPPSSLLLTCSCSRFIDMELFQKVVFSAISDAGRNATILRKSHHALDHPVSLFNPEAEYLKSVLLHIE